MSLSALEAVRKRLSELMLAAPESQDTLLRGKGRSVALWKLAERADKAIDEANQEMWLRWRETLPNLLGQENHQRIFAFARGLRLCQAQLGRQPTREFVPRSDSPLHQSVESLPGIGPKMAAKLGERGLQSVEDLLWLVPRRYDDVRRVIALETLLADPPLGERVVVFGKISSVRYVRRGPRGWIDLRMHCPEGSLVVRWFNARPGMSKRYEEGGGAVLAGKISERGGVCEMANPDLLALENAEGERKVLVEGVVPIYSAVPGVPTSTLRKACQAACKRSAGLVSEIIPADILAQHKLKELGQALQALHQPPDSMTEEEVAKLNEGLSPWHRRLAFEELFLLALVVGKRRAFAKDGEAIPCALLPPEMAQGQGILPFSLTAAQRRVVEEISQDLSLPHPMNRLLQGDVGSGKTAVAFLAALQASKAGQQVALMAPTSILAEQHMASLAPWCEAAGIKIALLTAATPKAMRETLLTLLAANEIDLLVGTHALLADRVEFAQLSLVLIDEQHRFGVAQRAKLRAKGKGLMPHLLVMTATPIPRTLAMTAYGELDTSVLDEMPPGRVPPRTQILLGKKGREATYRALQRRVERGERAYVVCPMVEANEELVGAQYANACDLAKELSQSFPSIGVGLVHGRMSSDERDEAMRQFRRGKTSILVATTVIEVGVDVPEAIVIVIEDADHFGLAQLHQLRGRVGRGGGGSECVLLSSGQASEEGRERLDILVATQDGFVIAEEDLRMRGPGELLGVRQAGLPRLRFGDLQSHGELLVQAKEAADKILALDPRLLQPEHRELAQALEAKESEAFGAESG